MDTLHNTFLNVLSKIGVGKSLEHFYDVPNILVFEIGDEAEDDIYLKKGNANPMYVEKAFQRAKKIFDSMPGFDLLRIHICTGDRTEWTPRPLDLNDLSNIGLTQPKEKCMGEFTDEDETFQQKLLYWDLSCQKIDIDKLLTEIIKADLGGFNELASAVYFMNTKDKIIYHLCDDRWLDVVGSTVETTQRLRETFAPWIEVYESED